MTMVLLQHEKASARKFKTLSWYSKVFGHEHTKTLNKKLLYWLLPEFLFE